jgi:DNA-binding response OmpR family regulator
MLETKKILLVDNDTDNVAVVQSCLENEGYEVIVANNGKIAIDKFYDQSPSLVILELMLPDMNGEDVCKEIKKCSKIPVVIATSKIDETSILNGFKIGADDYITKPYSTKQLVARVTAILRRTEDAANSFSGTYSFHNGDLIINLNGVEVRKKANLINLTQTEYNLLSTMIKHPNKAFTREELAFILYGANYSGEGRVIDTHIKNLRHKIESNSKEPMYILTVHGVGYKFGGV